MRRTRPASQVEGWSMVWLLDCLVQLTEPNRTGKNEIIEPNRTEPKTNEQITEPNQTEPNRFADNRNRTEPNRGFPNDDLCVFSRYTGLFVWALERRPQYP